LRAAPNPARGATSIEFVRANVGIVAEAEAPSLRLYNVAGRLVRELTATAPSSEVARVAWDGRDAAGRLVPPGLYFARATWKGAQGATRLVVLP
jgi:hypothetical protein